MPDEQDLLSPEGVPKWKILRYGKPDIVRLQGITMRVKVWRGSYLITKFSFVQPK
jgi:hypothetical protein